MPHTRLQRNRTLESFDSISKDVRQWAPPARAIGFPHTRPTYRSPRTREPRQKPQQPNVRQLPRALPHTPGTISTKCPPVEPTTAPSSLASLLGLIQRRARSNPPSEAHPLRRSWALRAKQLDTQRTQKHGYPQSFSDLSPTVHQFNPNLNPDAERGFLSCFQ